MLIDKGPLLKQPLLGGWGGGRFKQPTEQTNLSGGLFNLCLNIFFIFLFNFNLIFLLVVTRGHSRSLKVTRGHSYVVLVKILVLVKSQVVIRATLLINRKSISKT